MTLFVRNCPLCNSTIEYTDRSNFRRANKKKSACNSCTPRHSPESKAKISESLRGKKHPTRKSNTKKGKLQPFSRKCPSCFRDVFYTSKWSVTRANKNKSVCNSCSAKNYKKSWTYVIKEEHIKKMAANKAGYSSYESYITDLDNRKKYYREVRKITHKQDISILENYNKLRGVCGIPDAYQLDHIIPISVGYEQGIPPDVIGDILNLQIIPWKDNLLKSNKQ